MGVLHQGEARQWSPEDLDYTFVAQPELGMMMRAVVAAAGPVVAQPGLGMTMRAAVAAAGPVVAAPAAAVGKD